jgi:protein-tyrosine phosphatase
MAEFMIEIRSWLYVGKYTDTLNESILLNHAIDAMLQLHQAVEYATIPSLFVPVQDGEPLSDAFLERGVAFVRGQKAENKRVLVACSAGISRSVTFATASLKEEENLALLDAFHELRQKHPRAMPDHIHWEALCRYYREDIPFWDIWRESMDSQ